MPLFIPEKWDDSEVVPPLGCWIWSLVHARAAGDDPVSVGVADGGRVEGHNLGDFVGMDFAKFFLEGTEIRLGDFENHDDFLGLLNRAFPIIDRAGAGEDRAASGDFFGNELMDDVGSGGLVRQGGENESCHAGTGAGWRTIQPPPTTASPS